MRRKTGTDEIPALLLEDGAAITGAADPILAHLDQACGERNDAAEHRERAAQR